MERGFLGSRGKGSNHKKKQGNVVNSSLNSVEHVSKKGNDRVQEKMTGIPNMENSQDVDMLEASCGNTNDVNTDNVNMEIPLESNKGDDVNSNANVEPTISASLPASVSFATLLRGFMSQKSMNFCTLITQKGNGVDVAIPLESIREVSKLHDNSAYGFFWEREWLTLLLLTMLGTLGVNMDWLNQCLTRLTGYFSSNFSSKDGLDAMLENGPWFIRNNPLILKKWDSDVNLLKEDVGNVPVWVKLHDVPMKTFNEDGLSAIATKLGTPLMLDSYTSDMYMQSWGRSNYARAMIELRDDVELKDTIMVAMPKLVGEGFYTCTICVEYEWKPPRCWSCNVFGHVLNECPKKIVSNVVKNLNNPRQATRGDPVGLKQAEVSRQEVSNSNPFDALTLIKDDKLGTNRGISKSAGKGSLNVAHGSYSNNPIIDKIDKLENQILDGKLMFLDDDGNPLIPTSNVDSDSEVEVVFNETANLIASTSFKGRRDRGYGTNSLLEQWRETKRDAAYDSYDDDLYESHDMSDHLQAICDDLDLKVRDRKKK
ncbi:hypothetical protein Tco_0025759 [Tanacetum coccineum]